MAKLSLNGSHWLKDRWLVIVFPLKLIIWKFIEILSTFGHFLLEIWEENNDV